MTFKRKALAWGGMASGAARLLGDVFYPPKCALCHVPVDAAHAICSECFARLNFITKPQCSCCGVPFSYAPLGEMLCGECLADPPPYRLARAALAYDDVSRPLVTRLKYGDRPHLAILLARLMRQAGHEALDGADFIIPVPLHWRRQVARRYNQSLVLAHRLGLLSEVEVRPDLLQRHKATAPQVGLSRSQRLRNVATAFSVPKSCRHTVDGKTILLVDDVMTSGATMDACSKVLIKAGAAEIRILTLARRVLVE
jgi:ComF family protein